MLFIGKDDIKCFLVSTLTSIQHSITFEIHNIPSILNTLHFSDAHYLFIARVIFMINCKIIDEKWGLLSQSSQ